MTQLKTDLAYLRNEKAKAEQKLRSCQHREKILERQMSKLNRRERVHRLCTRAGMLESFLVCPGELTDDQVMELLKISFRQPEVVLALAKMVPSAQSNTVSHWICARYFIGFPQWGQVAYSASCTQLPKPPMVFTS